MKINTPTKVFLTLAMLAICVVAGWLILKALAWFLAIKLCQIIISGAVSAAIVIAIYAFSVIKIWK